MTQPCTIPKPRPCPGYQKYFHHLTPYMNAMAKLVSHGQPASLIMQAFSGPLLVPLGVKG